MSTASLNTLQNTEQNDNNFDTIGDNQDNKKYISASVLGTGSVF
jgi:hypothetical protein